MKRILCVVRDGDRVFQRRAILSGPPMRDADEMRGLISKIEHDPVLGKIVHDHMQGELDELGNRVISISMPGGSL